MKVLPGLLGCALGAALVALVGCGESGSTKSRVSGTITYEGKPVEKGIVQFEPQSNKGTPASGAITNGNYSVVGVEIGKYKVTVSVDTQTQGPRTMEDYQKAQGPQKDYARNPAAAAKKTGGGQESIPHDAVGNGAVHDVHEKNQTLDIKLTKPR